MYDITHNCIHKIVWDDKLHHTHIFYKKCVHDTTHNYIHKTVWDDKPHRTHIFYKKCVHDITHNCIHKRCGMINYITHRYFVKNVRTTLHTITFLFCVWYYDISHACYDIPHPYFLNCLLCSCTHTSQTVFTNGLEKECRVSTSLH